MTLYFSDEYVSGLQTQLREAQSEIASLREAGKKMVQYNDDWFSKANELYTRVQDLEECLREIQEYVEWSHLDGRVNPILAQLALMEIGAIIYDSF